MTDYETAVVLRLIAEEVCDRVMGEGTYEKINGFSPKKGQLGRGMPTKFDATPLDSWPPCDCTDDGCSAHVNDRKCPRHAVVRLVNAERFTDAEDKSRYLCQYCAIDYAQLGRIVILEWRTFELAAGTGWHPQGGFMLTVFGHLICSIMGCHREPTQQEYAEIARVLAAFMEVGGL